MERMFAAISVVHGEECSAVNADGQGVACAVVRGTITLVPYSIHFGQVTHIPMIRNVHWIRDRYCMLGIRTSGRLVSYVYHLLPSFERHR